MFLRALAPFFAIGLVALAGCGPAKLDVTKTYTLEGEPQIIFLDAQPKPQKITVEFESSASPITVLLIKDADVPKDEDGFIPTSKAIAFKSGEKAATFSGDVPENTATRVIIRNASNKSSVKVRVTNQ